MRSLLLTALITSLSLAPHLTHAQTASPGGAARGGGGSRGGSMGATIRQNSPARQTGRRAPNPARPIVPVAPPSAPPIGPFASPSALDRDVFRARPRTFAPRFDRSEGFFYGGGGGYVTDSFGYSSDLDSSAPVLDRYMRQGDNADGYLRLDVEPESAQVYVDGFYAGTVGDFRRGGGRAVDAGPHRVELRAEGYDSQSVELRVRANDVLSYRGTLNRVDDRPQLRASAAQPKTFYVIPRCYAGTSKPTAERLPAGCRLSDLREVPPVVAPAPSARK
jgi:PEGA domain-containing protein